MRSINQHTILIIIAIAVCFLAAESKYIRSEFVKDLDCTPFFAGSQDSIKEYAKNRIVIDDAKIGEKLPMDCQSIFGRTYFQREDLYPEEREFPIAFTRVVFRDYYMIERQLASTYAPQNFYCYVLDSTSPKQFRDQMRALAKCFPNVFVMQKEFEMNSYGKNMGYAHLECMKTLAKPEFKWKYMVLLQNHELALKTNQEMIQIFKWYNGANDIKAVRVNPIKELEASGDWSFKALKLFKDETRNVTPYKGYEPKLRFTKSTVHVSVSREMIDFMVNELDLTRLMKRIEESGSVVDGRQMYKDELLIGTLNAEDAIGAPGNFTHHCIDEGVDSPGLTALVFWKHYNRPCKSGIMRHSVCMLGVENLQELMTSKYLFANKFMPSIDYGAVECWHERMYNKTHLDRGTHLLKPDIYLKMRQVRFNRERRELGEKFDPAAFKCVNGDTIIHL